MFYETFQRMVPFDEYYLSRSVAFHIKEANLPSFIEMRCWFSKGFVEVYWKVRFPMFASNYFNCTLHIVRKIFKTVIVWMQSDLKITLIKYHLNVKNYVCITPVCFNVCLLNICLLFSLWLHFYKDKLFNLYKGKNLIKYKMAL